MLSHRGTTCLNQYINIFDEYLPVPDMDAKLFLAPPWTGAVLTPPSIDRNRTQALHRVIFGDGLNLVHIWEKLTEDQEYRFRKVIGLPDIHDRQLHPFQLKYTVDDSMEVWDRAKEEELQKWGILSNRIELMPGQTLIVPLDMPHVMKKLGPITNASQMAHLASLSHSSSPPSHATIISHAPTPTHSHSHTHSPHHPPSSSFSTFVAGQPTPPAHSPHHPISHAPLVSPPPVPSPHPIISPSPSPSSLSPSSPSPIVIPPAYSQQPPSNPAQPSFVPFAGTYPNPSFPPTPFSSASNPYPPNFVPSNTNTSSNYQSNLQQYTSPANTSSSLNSTYTPGYHGTPNYTNSSYNHLFYTQQSGMNNNTNPPAYTSSNYPNAPVVNYNQPNTQNNGNNSNTYNNYPPSQQPVLSSSAYPNANPVTVGRPNFSTTYQKATTFTPPPHSSYSPTSYTTYASPTKINPTSSIITKPSTNHPYAKSLSPTPTLLPTANFTPTYNTIQPNSLTLPPPNLLVPQHFPEEEQNKDKKEEEGVKSDSVSSTELELIHPSSMELDSGSSSDQTTSASKEEEAQQPIAENFEVGQSTQMQPGPNEVVSDQHTLEHVQENPISNETQQNSETTQIGDAQQIGETQQITEHAPQQIDETSQTQQINETSNQQNEQVGETQHISETTHPQNEQVQPSEDQNVDSAATRILLVVNGQPVNGEAKERGEETAAENKTVTKTQSFPAPILTYSGDCSFVGTTRESFARNVDLIKYWHRQLRRDHQPVSVHVDLAIYCLISYVVTSPTALQQNQILIEHFIGAIPHFKEFVAEESDRVSRYQAKYSTQIQTLLKKEARLDWTCRKCKCQLTNFLIRLNPTKNEASCFECWEEEQEAESKKEDKKRKKEKGKKASSLREGTFRFGTVESLIALGSKAAKLVNKL